jgi:hypothetical protein
MAPYGITPILISPLIYSHVNPYGIFKLDMMERIPIEERQSEIENTSHILIYSLLRVVTASLVLPPIQFYIVIDRAHQAS